MINSTLIEPIDGTTPDDAEAIKGTIKSKARMKTFLEFLKRNGSRFGNI
jgi:hypothetical protein